MMRNKKTFIFTKIIFAFGLFLFSITSIADSFCDKASVQQTVPGKWLQGSWGVRVVIPGGNRKKLVWRFKDTFMINQLAKLKTPKWVMLNLTEPSFGGMFTSTYPELNKEVSSFMTPDDDLLMYYISLLRKNNYKIILYFASQGPSLEFVSNKRNSSLTKHRPEFYQQLKDIETGWKHYLKRKGLSNQQATADIIQYYSIKFGKLIDGWWFDHGKWGDSELYIQAARVGNPYVAIAWNDRHTIGYGGIKVSPGIVWMLTKSASDVNFTDGHVTPTVLKDPWWGGNERLIEQVESCNSISGLRPHIFIPLQSTWRGGKDLFPEKLAINWTSRVITSGGAITWAAALQPPEFKFPAIWDKSFSILKAIDDSLMNHGVTVMRSTDGKN